MQQKQAPKNTSLSPISFVFNQADTWSSCKGSSLGQYQAQNLEQYSQEDDICTPAQIDELIRRKFTPAAAVTDPDEANIMCPICGKLSIGAAQCQYKSLSYRRIFTAHQSCLDSQNRRLLVQTFDEVAGMRVSELAQTPAKPPADPGMVGMKEYFVELSMLHPISDFRFARLATKAYLCGNRVTWVLGEEALQFTPNLVCVPFDDYRVHLSLTEVGSTSETSLFSEYLRVSRQKIPVSSRFWAGSKNIKLSLRTFTSQEEKSKLIQNMNYKYRYPTANSPILQIVSVEVALADWLKNTGTNHNNQGASEINVLSLKSLGQSKTTETCFTNKQAYESSKSQISFNQLPEKRECFDSRVSAYAPKKNSQASKSKIDLEMLIKSGELSSFVKNAGQSRLFQNFLDEATKYEVQAILSFFEQGIPDLIRDEYANYMVQKLFQLLTAEQRIRVLKIISGQMSSLVMNKQGTHTIQAFISLLSLDEEVGLVCQMVRLEFEKLCFHPISTHFIQKIVKIFPISKTVSFYDLAIANLASFATDKNAMCVLKYMLRAIKQSTADSGLAAGLQRQFVGAVTLHTQDIIQDSFGNYIIQFCYELFGEGCCRGITEKIILKIAHYSTQKFSTNVVSKCVNLYWGQEQANRLNQALSYEGILRMFASREGNKILLDLLDRREAAALHDKISAAVVKSGQQSRHYPDKWGKHLGVRSGPIGASSATFSEADSAYRADRAYRKRGR